MSELKIRNKSVCKDNYNSENIKTSPNPFFIPVTQLPLRFWYTQIPSDKASLGRGLFALLCMHMLKFPEVTMTVSDNPV